MRPISSHLPATLGPQLPHGLATKGCEILPVEPVRLSNGVWQQCLGAWMPSSSSVRRGIIEPLGRLGSLTATAFRYLLSVLALSLARFDHRRPGTSSSMVLAHIRHLISCVVGEVLGAN